VSGTEQEQGVVERFGVEAIPEHLRTVRWLDLFSIIFSFHLNPIMYLLGALAVTAGGLPLWWAVAAITVGQALCWVVLIAVARAGADDGLPGQVAMRGTFGVLGARVLTSPYRMIAATYWFAAQSLAGGLGIQAISEGLTGRSPPLIPVAVGLGAVQALLAVAGFDTFRFVVRVMLPAMVAFTGVLVALYLTTDDPAFAPARVFESPEQAFTWVGFATFVTVIWAAGLTNVTNVADFCRYARSRRDMQVGFFLGAVLSAFVTAFVGAYAAVATGELNPFVAVSDLTGNEIVLALMLVAIVGQSTGANIPNLYTAGMSLVNAVPRLGRLTATVIVAVVGVALAAFPDFVTQAEDWLTHLGNVATPLGGVILADYAILKRSMLDVPALFEPQGRYRYLHGVNPAAIAAVAIGVVVYYVVPDAYVKAAWGTAVGALVYLALARIEAMLWPSLRSALAPASA
jgi:NCS1 nucleoside transporter family